MLVNDGGTATQPRAPGHERPFTTSTGAAKHGRPSAATRAPGADVPPAIPAEAPGQYRLRAAPSVPVLDRSRLVQTAPGHGRPLAASSDVVGHDRPRATLTAPSVDVPLATTAGAPGQHRLRAVANATVALPAGQPRLRQECLPRVPANPRTHTHSLAHQHTAHTRTRRSHSLNRHSRFRGNPRPPVLTGGAQEGYALATLPIPLSFLHSSSSTSSLQLAPQSIAMHTPDHRANSPSLEGRGRGLGPPRSPLLPLSKCWRGGRGVRSTSHQAHPAIQVPPHPRPCSTAHTGLSHHHPSRAPPHAYSRLVIAA